MNEFTLVLWLVHIQCSIKFNESALVNKSNTNTLSIYAACAQISVGVCQCSLAIDLGGHVSVRVGGLSGALKIFIQYLW